MLARLLQNILGPRRGAATAATKAVPEEAVRPPTLERIGKLSAAAERAPIARHLEILYGDVMVGGRPLLELTDEAMRRSNTWNPPPKSIHRRERTFNLARYFLYASARPGLWAECGVFNGCSALALCLALGSTRPAFDGTGLHLIDSFAGLSKPAAQDYFRVAAADGGTVAVPPLWPQNGFTASVDDVRAVFAAFPGVRIHKGWIPEVLAELPDARWSFVHVDVDLYAPTRACLEHFLPRLVPGGVIICDDYGSLMFPGAARAWDEVCEQRNIPFVELPTGQSVILNT